MDFYYTEELLDSPRLPCVSAWERCQVHRGCNHVVGQTEPTTANGFCYNSGRSMQVREGMLHAQPLGLPETQII